MKKLLAFILIVGVILATFTMGLYSRDTGRAPWKWSAEDWHNWLTFTRTETRAASEDIGHEAKERTMAAWKWVGQNTQALYDQSKELLARLGPAEGKMAQPGPVTPTSRQTGEPVEPLGTATPTPATPPDPLDQRSPNYRYGKEWLRKGIDEWKVSLVHPGAANRAKSFFEKAIRSFESAKNELADATPVQDWLGSARAYLADTEERLQHIGQEKKPGAVGP
jgi:hypothetical protein